MRIAPGERVWYREQRQGRRVKTAPTAALVLRSSGDGRRVRIVFLRERWYWAGGRQRETVATIRSVAGDRLTPRSEPAPLVDALAEKYALPQSARPKAQTAAKPVHRPGADDEDDALEREVYLPSEEEIAAAAAAIRETWTETEAASRYMLKVVPWAPAEVSEQILVGKALAE